jgi:hypothetical protein
VPTELDKCRFRLKVIGGFRLNCREVYEPATAEEHT